MDQFFIKLDIKKYWAVLARDGVYMEDTKKKKHDKLEKPQWKICSAKG